MKKKRGFTLLELIMVLFIGSLLIVALSSVLNITIAAAGLTKAQDDRIDERVFIVQRILEDVRSSNFVCYSDDFIMNQKYQNNLGFVLQRKGIKNNDPNEHRYIGYCLRNNQLIRFVKHSNQDLEFVHFKNTQDIGENALSDAIESIEGSYFDPITKQIFLNIKIKGIKRPISTSFYCEVVYEE